jgi:hypothetical protein
MAHEARDSVNLQQFIRGIFAEHSRTLTLYSLDRFFTQIRESIKVVA